MKLNYILCYFIFHLFSYTAYIQSEGFIPRTVVKTISGYSCHAYCILPHNILGQNAVPVVVIFFPVVTSVIVPVVKTCCAVGATLLSAHFAKKSLKRHASNTHSSASDDYGSYYPDPDDPDKNKNKEHPHGIYKDAPYHHRNAGGNKSRCPKDGQRCLDYSLPTTTKQRIAIEGDNFVVLKYTSPGQYHGYIVEWKQLHGEMQNLLIKHGFVKYSGKIIKQITEKFLQ